MSNKNILNDDELEKVTGGVHTVSDSMVGTTVKLKYYGLIGNVKKIDAKVLEAAMLDGYEAGRKMYKLNVNNGYAIGWYDAHWATSSSSVFPSKKAIKSAAHSLETLQYWETNECDGWGD